MEQYRVLINGVPKSGTHALWRFGEIIAGESQYLSQEKPTNNSLSVLHDHIPYCPKRIKVNFSAHIYIIRNPRDVLVSWCRHSERPVAEQMLKWSMANFHNDTTINAYYDNHIEWYTDPDSGILPVFYENIGNHEVWKQLARNFKRVWCDEFTEDLLNGGTRTFNTQKSDWTKYWTPELERAWKEIGMVDIEQQLGYYNDYKND